MSGLDPDKVHYVTPYSPSYSVKLGKEHCEAVNGLLSLTKKQDKLLQKLIGDGHFGVASNVKPVSIEVGLEVQQAALATQQADATSGVTSVDKATVEARLAQLRTSAEYLAATEEERVALEAKIDISRSSIQGGTVKPAVASGGTPFTPAKPAGLPFKLGK